MWKFFVFENILNFEYFTEFTKFFLYNYGYINRTLKRNLISKKKKIKRGLISEKVQRSAEKISKDHVHACKQTETSLVELQSGLHLLLQWPHTASIIQRSSRWQDNPVCDVIFWFPRFTQGVSATHQPTARDPVYARPFRDLFREERIFRHRCLRFLWSRLI